MYISHVNICIYIQASGVTNRINLASAVFLFFSVQIPVPANRSQNCKFI